VKHVILMTDGEAPSDGIAELVQDMRASRITVSCVGVQGADRNLLVDDRRRRRGPALHGRGHRRAAEDLHEGDAGGAEEPARRGRDPRPGRQEVEAIEGTERRERAAAPRLRHDQAQADRRGRS
jgi:hypothetical protein